VATGKFILSLELYDDEEGRKKIAMSESQQLIV
jgi:hypothetical protein